MGGVLERVAPQCSSAPGAFARGPPVRLYSRPSGDVAQLGERRVRNAKVEGSIPFVSTNPGPARPPKKPRAIEAFLLAHRGAKPAPRPTASSLRAGALAPARLAPARLASTRFARARFARAR